MELIGPPLSPLSRSLRRGERWRQTSPTYIYYYYCYYNDTSRPPSLFVILTRLHVYHNHHRQGGNTYCNRTLIRFPQLPTSTFTTVAAAAKDLLPPTSSSAVGEYQKGRTFLRHLSSERERERGRDFQGVSLRGTKGIETWRGGCSSSGAIVWDCITPGKDTSSSKVTPSIATKACRRPTERYSGPLPLASPH